MPKQKQGFQRAESILRKRLTVTQQLQSRIVRDVTVNIDPISQMILYIFSDIFVIDYTLTVSGPAAAP